MFAVITDIHGNYPALRAAIQEIDNMGIDQIYCLGDMIGIGPDTNEVLDLLFSRKNVSMITGNHEEAVLALLNGEEYPESHENVRNHHEWIAERLDNSFIPKLKKLPRYINYLVNSYSIYFIHYHITQEKMREHISRDPFSSIIEPNFNDIADLFADRKENMICFGHHHPVHYFSNHKPIFLNPGSLGCNNKPSARYAIVNANETEIGIDLKEALYDNTGFLASYSRLQVPDREFILKVFHGNQNP